MSFIDRPIAKALMFKQQMQTVYAKNMLWLLERRLLGYWERCAEMMNKNLQTKYFIQYLKKVT